MNYKKEFLKMAKKFDVKVKFDVKYHNQIYVIRDYDEFDITIHLKDIKTERHFAGALHELGHAVFESDKFLLKNQNKFWYGYGKLNCTKFMLKLEYNAWKHATHLYPNWTKSMNDEFLKSIKTYIVGWETQWKTKLDKKFKAHITNLDNVIF